MIVAGLGRRLPQQLLPHRRRAGPARRTASPAGRPVGPRRPDHGDARAADRLRRRAGRPGSTTGCAARAPTRTAATSSSARRPGPEIDLDLHEGWWVTLPTVPPVTEATLDLTAPVSLDVVPDVGTAAWIDCAGHLPWGLSGDQRLDDERSLTWEIDPPPGPVVGHPVLRAKVWATKPAASLSVKICDVFPDGTSALVTRGTLDLAYRDGVHGSPVAAGARPRVRRRDRPRRLRLPVDAGPDAARLGRRRRLAEHDRSPGAGLDHAAHRLADAAAARRGRLRRAGPRARAPSTPRSRPRASAGRSTTTSSTGRRRRTTRSDSRYPTPYDGTAHELYLGEVSVDTRTFAQSANAHTVFDLTWPGIEVTVRSGMTVEVTPEHLRRVDLGDGRAQQRGDQPPHLAGVDPPLSR